MEFFQELIGNKVFMSGVTGWFIAQLLKTLINTLLTKSFSAERLVGSGGMPSSHSSTVCALTTSTAILYGVGSFEFAISAVFAIIVMYDAMGVRRETGKQAKLLNEIILSFKKHDGSPFSEKMLKEYVGHTPLQVFAGAVLGILIAVCLQ